LLVWIDDTPDDIAKEVAFAKQNNIQVFEFKSASLAKAWIEENQGIYAVLIPFHMHAIHILHHHKKRFSAKTISRTMSVLFQTMLNLKAVPKGVGVAGPFSISPLGKTSYVTCGATFTECQSLSIAVTASPPPAMSSRTKPLVRRVPQQLLAILYLL
jgi:hypothetical protein